MSCYNRNNRTRLVIAVVLLTACECAAIPGVSSHSHSPSHSHSHSPWMSSTTTTKNRLHLYSRTDNHPRWSNRRWWNWWNESPSVASRTLQEQIPTIAGNTNDTNDDNDNNENNSNEVNDGASSSSTPESDTPTESSSETSEGLNDKKNDDIVVVIPMNLEREENTDDAILELEGNKPLPSQPKKHRVLFWIGVLATVVLVTGFVFYRRRERTRWKMYQTHRILRDQDEAFDLSFREEEELELPTFFH